MPNRTSPAKYGIACSAAYAAALAERHGRGGLTRRRRVLKSKADTARTALPHGCHGDVTCKCTRGVETCACQYPCVHAPVERSASESIGSGQVADCRLASLPHSQTSAGAGTLRARSKWHAQCVHTASGFERSAKRVRCRVFTRQGRKDARDNERHYELRSVVYSCVPMCDELCERAEKGRPRPCRDHVTAD